MADGRKTGGRKAGTPNRVTWAVRDIAQEYTVEAVEALAAVMRDSNAPPAARVSAATALLDRGHGRPTQPIAGDDRMPPVSVSIEDRRAAALAILESTFGEERRVE
jgi:hypothetical protein